MEAIVLSGGLGTRLRGAVPDVPKSLAPIGGRPFLEILLSMLAGQGCTRLVLSLGYRAELIQHHFGNRFAGIQIDYEVEAHPLGTGGALRRALAQCGTDHVLALNGDTYLDLDIGALESLWSRTHDPIIVACHVDDTARYGRLLTEGDCVVGLQEKGVHGEGLINAGYYVLPTDISSLFPGDESFSFEKDFLEAAVKNRRFRAFESPGTFIDIGVPDDYVRAQRLLANV